MASWGAMQGLGEGLMGVGSALLKNELAKRLEDRRMEKQEELDAAREARLELKKRGTVDPSKTDYQKRDGVWFEVRRNAYGDELEAKLAPQNKIEEFNEVEKKRKREEEAHALSLEDRSLDIDWKQGREARDKRDYEQRQRAAQDASARGWARVNNSGSRGLDDTEPSESEAIDQLLSTYKQSFKDAGISELDAPDIAQMALRRAATDGSSPRSALRSLLEEYKAANPTTSTATGGGLLTRPLAQ